MKGFSASLDMRRCKDWAHIKSVPRNMQPSKGLSHKLPWGTERLTPPCRPQWVLRLKQRAQSHRGRWQMPSFLSFGRWQVLLARADLQLTGAKVNTMKDNSPEIEARSWAHGSKAARGSPWRVGLDLWEPQTLQGDTTHLLPCLNSWLSEGWATKAKWWWFSITKRQKIRETGSLFNP